MAADSGKLSVASTRLEEPLGWLVAQGEMAERLRGHDWAATPLGPASRWPAELRTLVKLMLGSAQPMFVAWGPERTMLYNDAYAPMCGTKHPAALGQPFAIVWADILHEVGPIMDRAYAGESIRMDDIELRMRDRHGRDEETHFSFSYSPVRDDAGRVLGMLCTCLETTAEVLARRRVDELAAREHAAESRRRLLLALSEALRPLGDARAIKGEAMRVLGEHTHATRCYYAEIEHDGAHAVVENSYNRGVPSLDGRYRLDDYGKAWLDEVRAGRMIVCADVARDPLSTPAERARVEALGIAAHIHVPIVKSGRLVSILAINDSRPRAWSDEQIEAVKETAERTWGAVQRTRAEQALRENEYRYRAIVESQSELICRFKVSGEILFANAAYATRLGATPDEMIGHDFWNFIPQDEHEPVRALLRRLSPVQPEVRIENHFGVGEAVRWMLWINRALAFDANGVATEVQSTGIDITERRRAEQALHALEARQRFLLELNDALRPLADPLEIEETAGRILGTHLRLSRALYAETQGEEVVFHRCYADGVEPILGRLPASAYGERMIADFRAGRVNYSNDIETDEAISESERAALRALQIGAYLGVPLVKRGEWLATLGVHSIRPRRWSAEDLSLVQEVAQRTWDAVERAKAQTALLESETRFRNMADHSPVMVWVTEPDGRCTFLSQSWYAFTGQTPETGLGFGWLDATHAEDRAFAERSFLEAVQRRATFRLEYRLRRRDGVYRWAIDAAAPRFGSDGSFQGYIGSVLDITDRKTAEQALQAADRQKNEFLAMLAHELRNPLAPIRMAGELLSRTVRDSHPAASKAIDLVQRQVTQLTRLVDDLLDMSRITQGRIELKRATLELGELIRQAIETVEPMLRDKRQELTVSGHSSLDGAYVHGDRARLVQCFVNLLTNASKYTDAEGRIALEHRSEDTGWAVVTVSDSGVGISAELLPRVFDLFVQADRTLDRAQGGLGIGLSVVRRLIEMHGGEVHAYSAGPGEGSTFTIRLPLARKPARAAEAPAPAAVGSRRTLIVDDNADAADTLAMVLQVEGHETRTVYDAREVERAVAEFEPEVVLLDIGLPELDGYELARRLRAAPRGRQLRLIALTGYGQHEDRAQALAAGFDAHLVKPADLAALTQALASDARDEAR